MLINECEGQINRLSETGLFIFLHLNKIFLTFKSLESYRVMIPPLYFSNTPFCRKYLQFSFGSTY